VAGSLSRYDIVIAGVAKTVDLEHLMDQRDSGKDEYQCQIVGKERNARRRLSIERRDLHVLLISLDDKIYSLRQTRRTSSDVEFILNGRKVHAHFPTEIAREETRVKSDIASISEFVSSNFPAKVVSIKVSKGDKLKAGDTLLVLEAMKMEAQIKAPRDCEVIEIHIHEGEMVPRGTRLVHLKFL
jgi:biotin carboxyl carrier protein